MGVSKVNFGNQTLIDLTSDTVTAESLAEGVTAHGADGEPIRGTGTLGSDKFYSIEDNASNSIDNTDYIPFYDTSGTQKTKILFSALKTLIDTDTKDWASITGKPSTFPPSSHTHAWSEITGKPDTFAPSSHTHSWDSITGKPSTFTPASHTHAWSEITGKPSTFTPASHTHSWSDITSGIPNTTLATDSGTATINLAANTTYKLTAAGKSVIFKTPADSNTWRGIQNNLTSDSTTDSLSAAQGKALKALIDGKTSNTGTVTSIDTGTGLIGGTITGSGTLKANLKTFNPWTIEAKYNSDGNTNKLYAVCVDKNGNLAVAVPWTDNNTWRGIQDNLTSDSTTDSLSAKQGKNLANGSARDSTKLPLAGGTLTGVVTSTYTSYTYVNSLTNTAFRVTPSTFGGWISGTTKNGNITIATYPALDNKIYFGYGESGRTANNYAKQMTWDGSTGNLAVTSINGHTIYDHSKAIKAITRSGTTFTYTCLDGTTGTFTQQDNDTTNILNQRSTYITGAQAIFTKAQLTVGTADNNAYAGSSNNYKLFSYPDGKTGVSGSIANIMNMRFMWGTSHWRDMFMSPNNDDIYIRGVVDGTAKPWYKLFDSGDTIGFANGGTGATTRLGAAKALTNENVSTNVEYVVGLTNSWGKFGYVSLADLITKLPNYKRFYSSWVYNIKIVSSTGSGQTIWLFTQEGYITMGTSGSAIAIGYCNMANASHWTYSKSGLTITLNCTDHIKPFILCSDNAITVTFTDTSTAQSSTLSNQWATAGHTHPCTIAADSGTNALTLAASTKYKLTAGGSSFIFTTPPNTTYSRQTAASGGTALSLVNTGDMYRWDNNYRAKSDSLNTYYYKKTITTSTSSTVTATFSVTHYTANMALSVFDVYVDNLNAKYTDIAISGTKVAVTFAKTSSAFSVEVTLIQIVTA